MESLSTSDDDEIAALREIVEGTVRNTGEAFFQSLVQHLAGAMKVSYAFVAEFAGVATRVRTLAYCGKGELARTKSTTSTGPLARTSCAGGSATIPTGSGKVPPRPGADRPGDRELPRGSPAGRARGDPRASGRVRRAVHAARAASTLHLPDLRHPCGRRARAPAGRAETLGERAALPGPLR